MDRRELLKELITTRNEYAEANAFYREVGWDGLANDNKSKRDAVEELISKWYKNTDCCRSERIESRIFDLRYEWNKWTVASPLEEMWAE